MVETKEWLWVRLLWVFVFSFIMQVGCTPSTQIHMARYNYLILKLESDRSVARVGEPVRIRFSITNEGGDTSLESPTTPVMDIVVSPMGSSEVLLTWSAQNPDKDFHHLEWKPGESKTIELVWIPRPEDIASGYYHDVHFSGILNKDSKFIQAAGVTVCASNFCR